MKAYQHQSPTKNVQKQEIDHELLGARKHRRLDKKGERSKPLFKTFLSTTSFITDTTCVNTDLGFNRRNVKHARFPKYSWEK